MFNLMSNFSGSHHAAGLRGKIRSQTNYNMQIGKKSNTIYE